MPDGETGNMRVVIRVRPNNRRELELNQRTIVKIIDKANILFDPDEEEDGFFFQGVKQSHRDITKRANKNVGMDFDRVFSEDETNHMLFEECTKPLVVSVMNGYNCSVFVYGATGAGKTYTMLGCDKNPGLTFLTMRELFNQINTLSHDRKFDIGISYLEIYNENVMNLLTKTGPLRLCEDSNGVVVNGLVLRPIYNADELINLLILGNKNRTQHPTDANAESSRSHAVFQVHIRMTDKKSGQKRTVKLSMIDLAGSERAASTKGIGVRFKEGASINKSLLALGNCINKLADGCKHIPYRDSNLTRLLKDSLGGNCQTVMIANVSPSSLTYEDTYNTLRYASRAKKIRISLKQNILRANMPKSTYVKAVLDQQNEIEKLKSLNQQLELKLQKVDDSAVDESALESWYTKIDVAYATLIQAQVAYLKSLSKEKVLKFRAELKEKAKEGRLDLCLDELIAAQDTTRMEASIDRFGKHAVKMNEESNRWRKRYNDALQQIAKLRIECQGVKYESVLLKYLQGKDYQTELHKLTAKHSHVDTINSLYRRELEFYRKMNAVCNEIISRSYLLLRANNGVDSKLRDNCNRLLLMSNGTRDVNFGNEQCADNNEEKNISFDIVLEPSVETVKSIAPKRANSEEIDTDRNRKRQLFESQPICADDNVEHDMKRFDLPTTSDLNHTHVVLPGPSNLPFDANATFQLPPKTQKQELINGMLMEQNANISNKQVLTTALEKSNVEPQKIMNKVSLAISKENVKKASPNKIRKNPRPTTKVNRAVLAPTYNLLNRQRTKSHNPDEYDRNKVVNINRAAMMRIRKGAAPTTD